MSEKDEAQAAADYASVELDRTVGTLESKAWRELRDAFLAGLAKGREMERQRAAEIAEEMGKSVKGGYNNAAHEIAAAIRSGNG